MEPNSDEYVKEAVKKHLESNGVLKKVRSMLRAETYHSLMMDTHSDHPLLYSNHQSENNDNFDDNQKQNSNPLSPSNTKVKQPHINTIIHHMIMEYLEFNGLMYSLSTFQSESSNIGNYGVNNDEISNENATCHGNQNERIKGYGQSYPKCQRIRREMIQLDLGLSTRPNVDDIPTQTMTFKNDNATISNDSEKIPLLYNIVEGLIQRKHDRQTI